MFNYERLYAAVGKSRFTVVRWKRHAGYDYYSRFITSRESHNGTAQLGTPISPFSHMFQGKSSSSSVSPLLSTRNTALLVTKCVHIVPQVSDVQGSVTEDSPLPPLFSIMGHSETSRKGYRDQKLGPVENSHLFKVKVVEKCKTCSVPFSRWYHCEVSPGRKSNLIQDENVTNERPEICSIKQTAICPLGLGCFLSGGLRIQRLKDRVRESPASFADI